MAEKNSDTLERNEKKVDIKKETIRNLDDQKSPSVKEFDDKTFRVGNAAPTKWCGRNG